MTGLIRTSLAFAGRPDRSDAANLLTLEDSDEPPSGFGGGSEKKTACETGRSIVSPPRRRDRPDAAWCELGEHPDPPEVVLVIGALQAAAARLHAVANAAKGSTAPASGCPAQPVLGLGAGRSLPASRTGGRRPPLKLGCE